MSFDRREKVLWMTTERLKLFSESLMRSSFLKQILKTAFLLSRSRSSFEIIEILCLVRRRIVFAGPNISPSSDSASSSSFSSLRQYSTVSGKVILAVLLFNRCSSKLLSFAQSNYEDGLPLGKVCRCFYLTAAFEQQRATLSNKQANYLLALPGIRLSTFSHIYT